MSSFLLSIQEHVKKYADMITTVFDIDVDITDTNLIRIAGTGRFDRRLGKPITSEGNAFNHVMETGEILFIENPETNPVCADCLNLDICRGQCEICFPIRMNDRIIGVISIASSSREQYEAIMRSRQKLVLFMENISEMISLKAMEYTSHLEMTYNLQLQEKLMNLITDGVMVLSQDDDIIYMNFRCEKILGNNLSQIQYLKKIKQFKISRKISSKKGMDEYIVKIRDKKIQLFGSSHMIENRKTNELNKVFILTDIRSLHENLSSPPRRDVYDFKYLIGESANFKEMVELCKKAAYADSCILLYGEAGTGKELIARAIHNESPYRNNQFVRFTNDSSAEDFVKKPVLTREVGPDNDYLIRNELLEGKTLYIDEVMNVSPGNQDILLSVIQSMHINNVRVICATGNDLKRSVQKGDFRHDLFYSLDLHSIRIPPLRERGRDVLLFVDAFLGRYNRLFGKHIAFSNELLELFLTYSWRGNIREVQSVVSYIVEHSEPEDMKSTPGNLPQAIRERLLSSDKGAYNLANAEKEMIIKALNDFGSGRHTKELVARELGISNATLYRKLKEYGIKTNLNFE